MGESLSFSIEGKFITDTARQWFYDEHKPYDTCVELVMSCLVAPEGVEVDIPSIARDVIIGRKKLVGVNSFLVEEDNFYDDKYDKSIKKLSDFIKVQQGEIESLQDSNDDLRDEVQTLTNMLEAANETIDKLTRDVESLTSDMNSLVNEINKETNKLKKYSDPIYKMQVELGKRDFIDSITWDNIFHDVTEELKQNFNEFCKAHGVYPGKHRHGSWEWINFYDSVTEDALTQEQLIERGVGIVTEEPKVEKSVQRSTNIQEEEKREPIQYGWLSPSGEFIPGDWGEHEGVAHKIIKDKGWEKEFWEKDKHHFGVARDFLCEQKGYCLIHNPSLYGRTQVTALKEYTKAQKEFLFDYFSKIGDSMMANSFYRDDTY